MDDLGGFFAAQNLALGHKKVPVFLSSTMNLSLEEFYKRKFEWIPEDLKHDIGHFNMFDMKRFKDPNVTIPYRRRDFYKIILVKGNSRVHYAEQVVEIKKQALAFSNPLIPYKWEHLDGIREGVYCIFSPSFFSEFGKFQEYEVFQPGGSHVFELSDEQTSRTSIRAV
jgi:hypothetical protein